MKTYIALALAVVALLALAVRDRSLRLDLMDSRRQSAHLEQQLDELARSSRAVETQSGVPVAEEAAPAPSREPQPKVARIGDTVIELPRLRVGAPIPPPTTDAERELLETYVTAQRCLVGGPRPHTDAQMSDLVRSRSAQLTAIGKPQEEVDKLAAQNWALYERCKGYTQATLDESLAALRDSDNPELRHIYAIVVAERDPEAARPILRAEWQRTGSILTLGQLSQAEPLGYKLAYMALMVAAQKPDSESVKHFSALLDAELASHTPFEVSEAKQQAAQIIRSAVCCAFP